MLSRNFFIMLLFCSVVFCQFSWAGAKKRVFDAPPEKVFTAALKVAHEQYKVEYADERDKTFVFTTGISPLSWGMRVLASVKQVGQNKSEIKLELKKKVGVLQITQWGAGGRMAEKYFDMVDERIKQAEPEPQPKDPPQNLSNQ